MMHHAGKVCCRHSRCLRLGDGNNPFLREGPEMLGMIRLVGAPVDGAKNRDAERFRDATCMGRTVQMDNIVFAAESQQIAQQLGFQNRRETRWGITGLSFMPGEGSMVSDLPDVRERRVRRTEQSDIVPIPCLCRGKVCYHSLGPPVSARRDRVNDRRDMGYTHGGNIYHFVCQELGKVLRIGTRTPGARRCLFAILPCKAA